MLFWIMQINKKLTGQNLLILYAFHEFFKILTYTFYEFHLFLLELLLNRCYSCLFESLFQQSTQSSRLKGRNTEENLPKTSR